MTGILFELLLLVTALSVDAFAVSFAYGMGRIRIPAVSVAILAGISSLTLALSLLAGSLLCGLLPGSLTAHISFVILFFLGLIKLFQTPGGPQADKANRNHDNLLSPGESLWLGAALSIDSGAAGIGAGMNPSDIPTAIAASFAMGVLAILSGCGLGKLMAKRIHANLGWISGVLLIFLAFCKIL